MPTTTNYQTDTANSLLQIFSDVGQPASEKDVEQDPGQDTTVQIHNDIKRIIYMVHVFLFLDQLSINGTSIVPIFLAKPGSVAQQPHQCSTAKSRKQLRNINRPSGMLVSMGERPNQRDVSSDVS